MLHVGTVLTSLDTHYVGPVSDGAGGSVLSNVDSGGDGGDITDSGVGLCIDVIGGAGVRVHMIGVLAEAVCLVSYFFPVTGTGRGSVLVLRGWSSKLVFLGSSSLKNLLFLSVNLLLLSTLTTRCSWGLTSSTTPVLSHWVR